MAKNKLITFEKCDTAPAWKNPVLIGFSILITFILSAGLILMAGKNPIETYYHFIVAPLSTKFSFLEVLVTFTPLLLCGVAVTFAFTSGYYNIGAEGQLYAGAVAATWIGISPVFYDWSPWILIPFIIIAGFAFGMLWALIPALLKVKMQVDEVVTTLLMNSIMAYIVSALLNGPWKSPFSGWPESPEISMNAIFPKIVAKSRLNLGVILALVAMLILWFVLNRTPFGLRMRAVGKGKHASKFSGINVQRTMLLSALISGGVAGVAGVSVMCGIQFRLISEISPGYGTIGVMIATMGGLNAFGVGLAAFFFALLDVGALTVSRQMGLPSYLGEITQATLLLTTISVLLLHRYKVKLPWLKKKEITTEEEEK
jgi:simple sugar transport system permease protein